MAPIVYQMVHLPPSFVWISLFFFRESGCVKLPSKKTLRDYTYYVSATIGFSDEVDDQLMSVVDSETGRLHWCLMMFILKMILFLINIRET